VQVPICPSLSIKHTILILGPPHPHSSNNYRRALYIKTFCCYCFLNKKPLSDTTSFNSQLGMKNCRVGVPNRIFFLYSILSLTFSLRSNYAPPMTLLVKSHASTSLPPTLVLVRFCVSTICPLGEYDETYNSITRLYLNIVVFRFFGENFIKGSHKTSRTNQTFFYFSIFYRRDLKPKFISQNPITVRTLW